jgi:hypothetical protein
MLPRAIFKIPSARASSFHNFESFFMKSTQLMVSLDILKGAHVLCVSGIGCPKSVYFILEKVLFFRAFFLICGNAPKFSLFPYNALGTLKSFHPYSLTFSVNDQGCLRN